MRRSSIVVGARKWIVDRPASAFPWRLPDNPGLPSPSPSVLNCPTMWFPARYLRFIAAFLFLSHQAGSGAAGESASFRPALVGNGPKSLVNLIDTAKLMQQGQQDAVVMFDPGSSTIAVAS